MDKLPSTLGLFVLSSVLVPGASLRLHVFEDRYKTMIGECIKRGDVFGVVLSKTGAELGEDLQPHDVGTAATIREAARGADGRMFILTLGIARFRVDEIVERQPYLKARVTFLNEPIGSVGAANALRTVAGQRFNDYLHALLALLGRDLEEDVVLPDDAAASSYLIVDTMQVPPAVKQRLLEVETAYERLRLEVALMESETRRLRALKAGQSEAVRQPAADAPFDVRFSTN